MRTREIPAWKQAPFFRILLPFCTGIVLYDYFPLSFPFLFLSSIAAFAGLYAFRLIPVQTRFRWQSLQGLFLSVSIMLAAMFLTRQADIRNDTRWFGHYYLPGDSLLAYVTDALQEKEKSFKTTVQIISLRRHHQTISCHGKMVVYFSKDSMSRHIQPGQILAFSRTPASLRNSGNPGSFDYVRYASRQGIYHSLYLTNQDWQSLGLEQVNPVNRLVNSMRRKILRIMQEHFQQNPSVRGIAEALLIGYKEHLDNDTVQEYTQAGVVHIIAISGLHLGLIYWAITSLLARIPGMRKKIGWQSVISLLSLWLFTLLTGASASVLRSAVMFTCILLGKLLSRKTTVYQSLTASAFLLLAWNPYLLWDAGFQLSYLALAGIVFLQRPIQKCYYGPNHWIRKVWELFSVTLAAQLGTFAICLFYFHQFPTWFFISNLVAVPLSTIILFLEIALIACNSFAWVATYLSLACQYSIEWMNQFISAVNRIPGSLITGIYADAATTVFLHILLIGLAGWLIRRKKSWFWTGAWGLIGFTFFHSIADMQVARHRQIILYNISKHQAIDFIDGSRYVFYGDDTLCNKGNLRSRYLDPARTALQLTEATKPMTGLEICGPLIRFHGYQILHINRSVRFSGRLSSSCKIDMVLVSGNPSLDIPQLFEALHPSIMVFDPSNSLWKIAEWKKACSIVPLPCFSIPEEGALFISYGKTFPERFSDS